MRLIAPILATISGGADPWRIAASRPRGLRCDSVPRMQIPRVALAFAFVALVLAPPVRAAAPAPARSTTGMVVTPQADATHAGVAVLRAGGNAIDAAIAVSLALGVTDPHHSGIGGGGFMLVRLADGRCFAVDARETAPAAATRDMYVAPGVAKDASKFGALSIATPGLLAGLALAH